MAKIWGVETGHGIQVPQVLIHKAEQGVDIYVPENQYEHILKVIAPEKREYSIVSDEEHDIQSISLKDQKRPVRIEYVQSLQLPIAHGEKVTLKRMPPLWKVA